MGATIAAKGFTCALDPACLAIELATERRGAPKIKDRLRRKHSEVRCPAISTVHAILARLSGNVPQPDHALAN
jgi:hypothetical protein